MGGSASVVVVLEGMGSGFANRLSKLSRSSSQSSIPTLSSTKESRFVTRSVSAMAEPPGRRCGGKRVEIEVS